MSTFRIVLLNVLAIISTTSAFNTLLPWDKEVIYNYKSLVKAGTHFPTSHVSQFMLHGKLHLQANDNSTFVKLTDLKYQLYNGVLNNVNEHESQDIPAPDELEHLQNVFEIVYDHDGKVLEIVTSAEEKEYTRNIKKAIAAILQLDLRWVPQRGHVSHAFQTQEHSIYGWGDVNYNILRHQDNVTEVQKFHVMHSTDHLYKHVVMNPALVRSKHDVEEFLVHDSQKKYILKFEGGDHIVHSVEADSGIFYNPLRGKSDSQYILVNQTLEIIEVIPVKDSMHDTLELKKDWKVDNHLTYNVADKTNTYPEAVHDVTFGRAVLDYEKMVPQVQQMLRDIWQYLHEDHLQMNFPDIKQGQLVNRIQNILIHFDTEHLKQVLTLLKQKTTELDIEILNVFHHILPLVGTRASTVLIKDLIVNKQVSDEVAEDLLQNIPQHIIQPTIEVVEIMAELINSSEEVLCWLVKKATILSFGSLIEKTNLHLIATQQVKDQACLKHSDYVGERYTHHHGYQCPHGHNEKISQLFEKYIAQYVKEAKESDDYFKQIVYLNGLHNMKLNFVLQHLIPAIKGEWSNSHHLRLQAIISSSALLMKNADTAYEVLWPIISNVDEHPELRMISYIIIMRANPSVSTITNIYWTFLHEPNQEVYNFHYTFVQSVIQSTEIIYQDLKQKLLYISKYMQPSNHGVSMYHLSNYNNEELGFGGMLTSFWIKTNVSHIFSLHGVSEKAQYYGMDYAFVVKIQGLAPAKYLSMVSNFYDQIHAEIIVMKHNTIVNTLFIDAKLKDMAALTDLFSKRKQSLTSQFLHISYDKYVKILIPTDMGIPALFEYSVPVVHKNNINAVKELANRVFNIHIDNTYISWAHHCHGLSFYNPFANIWQGINRYHSHDVVLPIQLGISFHPGHMKATFTWTKSDDVKKNIAGLRSHVTQLVFVKDDNQSGVLKRSTPKSDEWAIVSNGKEYRKNFTLMQDDDLTTGHKWHVGVYDSENDVSNGTFSHLMNKFFRLKPYRFSEYAGLDDIVEGIAHWKRYISLMPSPATHGLLIRVEPSTVHEVTNIDLTIRFSAEMEESEFAYTPATTVNSLVTYSVKNKEKELKTWDVGAIFEMNHGHTVNNLQMNLTRTIPGQKDYTITIDGEKKWVTEGVTGHAQIVMNHASDSDGTVIDITMTGKRSYEQDHKYSKYEDCQYTIPYSVQPFHTIQCLTAHQSLRHYEIGVKSTNVQSEFKKFFTQLWDFYESKYMSYLNYGSEHSVDLGEDYLKVKVVYPMQGHEVDIQVVTPQNLISLTGVPSLLRTNVDNLVYPWALSAMHFYGYIDHCIINHEGFHFNHGLKVNMTAPQDWTLYMGEAEQNPQFALYVKHIEDNQIALKLVDKSHVVEAVPTDVDYQVTVDQRPSGNLYDHQDWISYYVITNEVHPTIVILLPYSGIHVEFNGHQVIAMLPQIFDKESVYSPDRRYGKCYDL